MWPLTVIDLPPPINYHLTFSPTKEQFFVEALVTEFAMEALNVTVLPGTARRDEHRCGTALPKSARQALGCEFLAVVTPGIARNTPLLHQFIQGLQHVTTAHLSLLGRKSILESLATITTLSPNETASILRRSTETVFQLKHPSIQIQLAATS